MVDESRLIELLEGGASLAVCAAEFGVSRNAIHKRKQKLIAEGKLKADKEEPEPEDSELSELERKTADTLDEFRAVAEAHEHVRGLLSSLPGRIDKAKKALAEVGAAFYLGEATEEELTTAEMELEDLEREFRTAELTFPALRKKKDELRRISEETQRVAIEAGKARPFTEMKARFRERGIPLSCGEERELRGLAVGKQRHEVDELMRELDDMTGRRVLTTGKAQPREEHWTT